MSSGIYKWTSPNGKSYIGLSVNLKKRKKEFLKFKIVYTSKGSAIDNARQKYNNESYWQYEILEYCSISQLNEREKYYIEKYNTYYCGYNSTFGGDGAFGLHHTEEAKKKMSEACKRNHKLGIYGNWYKSKELSDMTSKRFSGTKLSEERKLFLHNLWFGHKPSKESREKASRSLKKKYREGFKNINQIKKVSKEVNQYDLNNNFIQTFPSLIQAAKSLGKKDAKQIRKVCQGKKEQVYGYIWKFK